jgi:large subunit ribosomal protein L18
VIDDVAGNTIVSASTIDPGLREQVKGLKQAEKAHLVGKTLAIALSVKVSGSIIDSGWLQVYGTCKSIGEGVREGGLKF